MIRNNITYIYALLAFTVAGAKAQTDSTGVTAPPRVEEVSMQPDPEDEDYVEKKLDRKPVNTAEGTSVMNYVLENRYRGFDEEYGRKLWYNHVYVELGAGAEQTIAVDDDYQFHPMTTFHVGIGKMFTPWHTARLSMNFANGYQKTYDHRYYKYTLKADYLFNLTAFSKGYNPMRPLEVQFLAGLGLQHSKAWNKPSVWTPEAHLGMQLKVYGGPFGYIGIEPYVAVTSQRTDGSARAADAARHSDSDKNALRARILSVKLNFVVTFEGLIDDFVPRQALLGEDLEEWVGVKFLDVVYAGLYPLAGEEHHGAGHGGHAGGVAYGLHAGFAVSGFVGAVIIDVVCEGFALFVDAGDAAAD